jgi:hypothetical protein
VYHRCKIRRNNMKNEAKTTEKNQDRALNALR